MENMVGPPGAWKITEMFPLEFLKSQGLNEHNTLLEIGCGVLRVGIHLIRYLDANSYTGIDIRPEVIDISHQRVAKHQLGSKNPILLTTNSFGHENLENIKFDYVLAFQVLYHLEDFLVELCMQQVSRRLKRNGRFFANVNVVAPPASWQEFPLVQRPLEFYRTIAEQHGLSMEVLGQLKEFGYSQKLGGHRNHMIVFSKP
jgi:SAM-dependent methyltransferase